jgi:hypothetical protein
MTPTLFKPYYRSELDLLPTQSTIPETHKLEVPHGK